MDLKFMQDLYNKEFSTRDTLAQRATTIIAAMTTLGGVLAFAIVNFKRIDNFTSFVVFWLLACASGIFLLAAAFYLAWSYRVPPLNDLAKPTEWLSYWNDLKQQNPATAEVDFTDYLLNQYAAIGDSNIAANFKRGTRLVRSNNLLLVSLMLVLATLLSFYYNNYLLGKLVSDRGAKTLLIGKDTLICLPAAQVLGSTNKPKPRPVPVPGPPRKEAAQPGPRPVPIPENPPPSEPEKPRSRPIPTPPQSLPRAVPLPTPKAP